MLFVFIVSLLCLPACLQDEFDPYFMEGIEYITVIISGKGYKPARYDKHFDNQEIRRLLFACLPACSVVVSFPCERQECGVAAFLCWFGETNKEKSLMSLF